MTSLKLTAVARDNFEFFKVDKNGKRFCESSQSLLEVLKEIAPIIKSIEACSSVYDFDATTPGNGYRSFVYLFESAVQRTLEICEHVRHQRESFFFRKVHNEKELAAYVELFHSLLAIGRSLVENHRKSTSSCLLSNEGVFDNSILQTMKSINLRSFYGRALLFHEPNSLRLSGKGMAVFMATFSEFYYSNEFTLVKLLRMPYSFVSYFLSPSKLSRRLVHIYEHSQADFGRSLMDLLEWKSYRIYQAIVEPKIAVNEEVKIAPDPLQIYSEFLGKLIDIPVPTSHIGIKPVCCRLLSRRRRSGMLIDEKIETSGVEPSRYLIFHAHGGGWITQSSRLHGSYSKEWAKTLDVPIVSMDYSLAPEAPAPRAVEEVFYAYCYVLRNPNLFGWTGENIVLVGDSAGANLVTTCVNRCIETGVPKPKGLLTIYAAFEVDYLVAPSRYLGFMDVVLPYMTHMRLFSAYCGTDKKAIGGVQINRKIPMPPIDEFDAKIPVSHLTSPRHAPKEVLRMFPPTIVLSTNLDSCLDECVEFAKTLKSLGVDVKLDVLEGLNHGFLNFTLVSAEAKLGSKMCMQRLSELLEIK